MSYAIITVGGKQYRVREGEWLLVDRLHIEEGKTFHPDVLLIGGNGEALLDADELKGQQVTARVTGHVLGKKVIVGKHKQRTGYRRRNGARARLSKIEIEAIGKKAPRAAVAKPAPAGDAPAAEAPKRAPRKPRAEAPAAAAPKRSPRKKATTEGQE
jgi:large subunit ribosomal protein L21